MKKLIAVILCIGMLLSANGTLAIAESAAVPSEEPVLISSLSEEECIAFLASHDVTIPEALADDIDILSLVERLEANLDVPLVINWTVLFNFTEAVRGVLMEYYGVGDGQVYSYASADEYTLQASTLYSWDPSTMLYYNCYAYAIGRLYGCDPGDFSGQSYDDTAGISSLAYLIKTDLMEGLGYDCVHIQTNRPSSYGLWDNVIAVRKDTTGDWGGFNDYHFARFFISGWRHKPGNTAVLKFINAPTNSVDWTNEYYAYGVAYEGDVTYDSNIRYLLYKANHGSTTYTYMGEEYHSGARHYYRYDYVCNDCGESVSTVWESMACSGPPCQNLHQNIPVPPQETE